MNEGHRAAIINDAYIVQLADELTGRLDFSPATARRLAGEWLGIVKARSEPRAPASIHKPIVLSPETFAELTKRVAEESKNWRDWPSIVSGTLEILAQLLRADAFGWNTPPDYAHAERLLQLLPKSKIVFLIRDPLAVLLSYKCLPDYWGDERNRYNPFLQSLVWRQMVRHYEAVATRFPQRVHLTRYEDLIADPAKAMKRISAFAGVAFDVPDIRTIGSNSSLGTGKTNGLSLIECWVCERITGSLRRRYGYDTSAATRIPEWGVVGLFFSLWRSASFYAARAVGSRDFRNRMLRFAKLLISRH